MSKNIKYTLEQNGIGTDKYLSLRINKDDLPDGAELVLSVSGGDGHARPRGQARQRTAIAANSQFYGRIMADGFIFNPYSHRRFIAAQFKRLIKRYGFSGIKEGVIRSFDWAYAIDILRKEVHKLKNLQKYDQDAFAERSLFFTLGVCASILVDYAEAVHAHIDSCAAKVFHDEIYVCDYGLVKRGNIRPMKHRFTQLAAQARSCASYAQLDVLLTAFDWLELPRETKLTPSFTAPFIEEGAYYTLKHDMMFEGLRMYNYDQQKSLAELRKYRHHYLDLAEHLL